MKKLLLINIVVALVFSICSCNINKENNNGNEDISSDEVTDVKQINTEDYLNLILEIDSELYIIENNFNHRNSVSDKAEYLTDSSVVSIIKREIDNSEKELKYQDTLFYPIGEKRLNRYFVNGNEDNTVLVNQDGTVNAILYEFVTLDISETATPNEVLPVLVQELNKWIRTSDYEHINIPEYTENSQGFGIYDFLYYNSVDGYMTDYVKVSVSDDGCVFGFWINDLNYDNISLNIDKELETELLNLKLKDIYDTDNTEYNSYNTAFIPQVVIYNNKPHIRYFVSANYSYASGGEATSWINNILIPVDLITAK